MVKLTLVEKIYRLVISWKMTFCCNCLVWSAVYGLNRWGWCPSLCEHGQRPLKTRKAHKLWDLRPTMCWTIILPANFNTNPLNIQILRLHKGYHFEMLLHLIPFGHYLKGKFWDPKFWVVRRVSGSWDLYQSKARRRLPNTYQYSFARSATIWPKFQCQIMVPNSTPVWGIGVDLGGS